MCSEGVTPSVSTRVRNRPWVAMAPAVVDPPVEDQRDPVGAAEIEVLTDDRPRRTRARSGRSSIWVRENSAYRMETS